MAKLARRKDIDLLHDVMEHISGRLTEHGERLGRLDRELRRPLSGADLERVTTLLDGVRVALERMGGNSLPSFRNDVLALRDQMGEFRRELSGYRSTLMDLREWLDTVDRPAPQPKAWSKEYSEHSPKDKPKRSYNRRKKSNPDHLQVEILAQDVAPHNNSDEESDVKS